LVLLITCQNFLSSAQHVPRINGEIPSIDEATSDHERLLNRYCAQILLLQIKKFLFSPLLSYLELVKLMLSIMVITVTWLSFFLFKLSLSLSFPFTYAIKLLFSPNQTAVIWL